MVTAARVAVVGAAAAAGYAASSTLLVWAGTDVLAVVAAPGPAPLDACLGLVAAAGAWLLLTWLAGTFLLALVAAAGARAGTCVRRAADRFTPAAARRLAAAALGAGLVAAPVCAAGPAAGNGGEGSRLPRPAQPLTGWTADRPAPPPPGPGRAHPATGSAHPATDSAHPATGSAHSATGPSRPARVPAGSVVVRPGDTLWAIAARSLGPAASAGEVAAEWPRWHAANRDLIGADPDLIVPGVRLRAPPRSPGAPTRPATPPTRGSTDPTTDDRSRP